MLFEISIMPIGADSPRADKLPVRGAHQAGQEHFE